MFQFLKYFAFLYISLRQTALGQCTNHACDSCYAGSSTSCQTCNSVYHRYKNVNDCPCMAGYYDNNVADCESCHVTCLTCRGPATTDCYTCDASLYRILQNKVSITCACKWVYDQQYRSYFCSNGDPRTGDYHCSTCADVFSGFSNNYCDDNTKKLFNGNFCGCLPNYYDPSTYGIGDPKCLSCFRNCLTCYNPNYNSCLSCNATNFRTLSYTTICVCQQGYFDNGPVVCQTCHFSCQTCTNATSKGCDSCNQAQFRQFSSYHQCLCQRGYYENGSAICGACHVTCKSCTSSLNSDCTSCNSADLRARSKSSCPCNNGYFDNGIALCAPCDITCQTCTDATGTGCSSCNSANLRIFLSNSNTCLCKPGTVDNGTSICAACDYSCQTCAQVYNTNCSTCDAKNFRVLSQSTCLCTAGYFNNGTSKCASCNLSCLTCTGATNKSCLSCDPNNFRILFQTSCLCLPGYFEYGAAICGACDYSCKTCTDGQSTSCISCDSTSLRSFFNNSCPCNQGYFDNGNSICGACHFSCQSCINTLSTGCISCNATNFRNQSQSRCLCLPGYFDNQEAICGPCDLSCQTCTKGINTSCSSCNSSNFRTFMMHTCRCDDGYYNNGSAICQVCDHSCYTCNGQSNTNCLSCDETNLRLFFSNNNTCTCTFMYFDNGFSMCSLICDVSCQTCSDYTINGCLSCNGSFPYYRSITDQYRCQCIQGYYGSSFGTCIPINCTINQYFDQQRQQCGTCHLTCQTCSGPFIQQCLSCNSNSLRTLKNTQCICPPDYLAQNLKVNCTQFCQAGQYQIGSQCQSCHPICSKCKGGSPLDCTACQLANYDELNTNQNSQLYYQNSPIIMNLNIKSYICQDQSSKQVSLASNDSSINVMISATNMNTNKEDFVLTYSSFNFQLPKQTFLSGEKYQILMKLIQADHRILQNQQQTQKFNTSFILEIMSIAKIITLAGGNRVVGNSENFTIECQIFDFNHQDTPIKDISSYNFSWTCNPITYNVSCLDRKGQILDTSSNNQFLALSATDLTPYNSYQFNVVVYDTLGRLKYNSSVIYQVVDQNIPTLSVIFDPNILALPVNLNLQQQFQFVYPLPINPDDLFFSANLLYNFDVVSTIIYHYSTVNFRIWDYYTGFTNTSGTKLYFNGQVYNPKFLLPSLFTIIMNVNIPPQMCEILVSPDKGAELIDLFLIKVVNCTSSSFIFTYRFAYYQSQIDYDHDTQQQSFARASIQTSFQASNLLITYLPRGKNGNNQIYIFLGSDIILVISVQDNIGGVQNYTKTINVTPIHLVNETTIVGILNNFTDLASQLRYLQVISVSLMNMNSSFPILTPVMDQILVKAHKTILTQEQQNQLLQIYAFTSSQTTDQGSLILSQKSTSENIIQHIKNSLIFTKANPSSILNQQTDDILINLNTILDSQHVLGTIILDNLNQQQNSSQDKNSTEFQIINQQNQQVMDLLNQTRLIQIQQMTPNEGTKLLKSQHGFSAVALTTKKLLGELLGKDIIDDTQTDFFTQSTQEDKNNYYTFSYLQYNVNPYSSDQSFPYQDQGFPAIDLQITQQSKSKISSRALQYSPNIKPTQYLPFQFHQKPQHSQKQITNKSQVCVSKVQLVGWTAQECQTIITRGRQYCQCNTINPTTVVIDYKELFNGSNSAILSSSSLDAIKSFHWQEATLLWIIVGVTFIYLLSLPLGWRKDKFDRMNDPRSKLKQQDDVQKTPQDILSYKVTKDSIIEDEKNSINHQEIKDVKHEIDQQPKESNQNDDDENQECIKKEQSPRNKNRDRIEQNQKNQFKQHEKQFDLVLSPKNGIYLDIVESPQIRQSSVSVYVGNISELEKLEKERKDNITFIQYFLINHNFTNVYYSFEQLNRPIRSSLLFLCLISNLAITVYFGSNFQIVKSIILSVLSSIATTITITTLKVLLTNKSLVLNIIGVMFFISSSGFLIFIILAIVSQTKSIQQTNIWSLQYTIQIVYDSTLGSIIPLMIKYKFLR